MLGEYIIVCLVFVVVALFEFALIIILNRKIDAKKPHEKRDSSLLREQNISMSQKHEGAKIAFGEDPSKETRLSNADQMRVDGTKRSTECIPSISPIHVIDFTASFIYPLAFVMYNCFYWSRSLDQSIVDR